MRQPEYQVWVDMRHRCLSPKSPIYKNYGGRGITICPLQVIVSGLPGKSKAKIGEHVFVPPKGKNKDSLN